MGQHLLLEVVVGEVIPYLNLNRQDWRPSHRPRPVSGWAWLTACARPCGSFNDVIRPRQQRRRDREAESLEIDDERESRRLLDR
jgi:hypothetical protein